MRRLRKGRGGAINWAEVRERLARAQAATSASADPSPERLSSIMDERTRALARAPPAETPAGETLETLTFALGAERYAIEAKYVREIVRLADFTPVPGAGTFVRGVTNLRGEVLCIIDLRTFLGVPGGGLTDLSRIVVLGEDRAEFGVLADQAHEIGRLPRDGILAPPESVSGPGRATIVGVTRDALILLDGAVLLRDPRLFVDQSEAGAA